MVNKQVFAVSLLIAGLSGLMFGGVGGLIVGFQIGRPSMSSSASASSKIYTREEFRNLAMGKSQAQLIQLFGKPDSTNEDGRWFYYDRVRDPISGKIDFCTTICFSGGNVCEVYY